MTTAQKPTYYPPIDEGKVPPEIHQHLRFMYDRLQNHFSAIGNQQKQIEQLQAQIAALQGK